ncbi:DMT family transporter [Caminibacter mediatlanticus TB-2]|uniref:DMT family transporter n=1 Tax=Caminibacter mediatlanticus TB-2 TaxID=391592 RepID=A0ABX5VAJ5_9BACT|nr:DMT family transporter [Caminibacter mediatlanticus]QCT94387.1 DMT family transporter [Caminibacter mediatlanticus TB-2]
MDFKKISDLLLVLVAIAWGSTFILVQNALQDIPPFSFLFIRFFLAFALMYIIFYKKISYNISTIKAAMFLGLFNFLAFSLQTYALLYEKSSIVAFVTGFYVVIVPFFAFLFFKKQIKTNVIIGAFLSLIGLYLLSNSSGFKLSFGITLTLLCDIFVALHILFTDIYSKKYNIFSLVTFQFLFVSLFSLIFTPFEHNKIIFSFDVFLAIFVTVIFATIFAYLVQTYAQRYTSPTKTAVIFTLEPVSAAIIGYFFGEILTLKQIIGGILVIAAILISEIGDKFKINE